MNSSSVISSRLSLPKADRPKLKHRLTSRRWILDGILPMGQSAFLRFAIIAVSTAYFWQFKDLARSQPFAAGVEDGRSKKLAPNGSAISRLTIVLISIPFQANELRHARAIGNLGVKRFNLKDETRTEESRIETLR
jgi:hypothetical protein